MVRVIFVNFFLQQNRINLITSVPMIVGKLQFSGAPRYCLREVLLELFQKLVGAAAIGGRARKREISLSLESATKG